MIQMAHSFFSYKHFTTENIFNTCILSKFHFFLHFIFNRHNFTIGLRITVPIRKTLTRHHKNLLIFIPVILQTIYVQLKANKTNLFGF